MSAITENNATEQERLLGLGQAQAQYTFANDEEYGVGLDIDDDDDNPADDGAVTGESPSEILTQCLQVPAFACIMVTMFLAAAFIEHLKTLSLVRSFP